jgi:Flp pilus assembly protein TadD
LALPRRSFSFATLILTVAAVCLTAVGSAPASDLEALANDCFSGDTIDATIRAQRCSRFMADPRVEDTARATALMVRGKARLKAGDVDGALADHARAIELWPANPTLHAGRAETMMLLGRFADAKLDLDQAIDLDPSVAIFFLVRGTANIQLGSIGQALSDLQATVKLNPNDASAHHLLGALYRQLGRNQEALQAFEAAQTLKPDLPGLVEDIAQLESELGGI